MIGERVNDYDGVLARLNYFIQITNCAMPHCRCQRAIMPDCLFTFDQEATDEICRRKIFVTSNRDQRPFEPPGHVLDKSRFAATCRAFENHWEMRGMGGLK